MYKFVFGFALMVIILWGCKDEMSKTGLGLLDKGDLVSVSKSAIDKEDIKAYTVTDVKQRTDEPAYNLLGSFNDPVFGKTTTDFACQIRLTGYPDFSKNAKGDSLVLYLYYNEVYGDTLTPQRLKVYELASDLSLDGKYYQELEGVSKGEVLADYSYVPKFRLDSLTNLYGSTKEDPKDTITQVIGIKLNLSLITKLMAADTLTLSDNDKFLEYFKGLYVEAADLNAGGAIMKINTVTQSNSIAHGSYLVLHYHNSEEDSLFYSFSINSNAARVNRFVHNYNTPYLANLDKQDQLDSLIYLQTTGGLASKIFIPRLGSIKSLFPELGSDTTNLAINKAELIFQVDTVLTDTTAMKVLPPPYKVILSAIAADGSLYFPSDVAFSQAYFGGFYNSKDKTYRFNIAKHMQEMIDKKKGKENYGFYLSTDTRNTIFRRVVLKGTTSKTGIRLDITYSKTK